MALRIEQRVRFDSAARSDPAFQRDHETAQAMPMTLFGQNIRICTNEALLLAACEYAGMLAALRWASDERWTWSDPAILALDGTPADTPSGDLR